MDMSNYKLQFFWKEFWFSDVQIFIVIVVLVILVFKV
jgi:hypothetical protein